MSPPSPSVTRLVPITFIIGALFLGTTGVVSALLPGSALAQVLCRPAGGQCANGDPCTSDEHCQNGSCQGGAPSPCADANLCTTDACDPFLGCVHPSASNGTACADGDLCNGDETCQAGVCTAGAAPSCDDGLACMGDGCQPSVGCTHAAVVGCCAINADCDDGNPCSGVETCNLDTHTCQPGTPLACNDGNPCNGLEICNPANGSCQSGTAPSCGDSSPCTADACVPETGCTHTPISGCCFANAECNDGSVCNGSETCNLGTHTCEPGAPLQCDDANQCNGAETCAPQSGCQSGAPLVCTDGVACTTDACEPTSGCTHTPIVGCCANDDACTDGNTCTGAETCDPTQSCVPGAPVGCSDGNVCNGSETCNPATGGCQSGPPLVCDDSNPCTTDSCDPITGCSHVALTNGASCSDQNACNGAETCQSGQCAAGTPLSCGDNTVCNGLETCSPQTGCQSGTPLACDDSNPCTTDSCDPVNGCQHTNLTDGASCSDGNACNGAETCQSGACTAGTPAVCDDANACTDDSCSPATGCAYANNTAACSDDNACTVGDVCGGGGCVPGPPQDCNDSNTCSDDLCDSILGCVYYNNSSACTDGNSCTTTDVCNTGVCVGGNTAGGCATCSSVATIPAGGGTFVGQTSGTGSLSGTCASSSASPERVYQWTPSSSGSAIIQTCGGGTFYDTVLHVRGASCAGTELACNDDTTNCGTAEPNDHHGSKVTMDVTAGQSYFIAVDGYNGVQGSYTLTVLPPTFCGNDVREGPEQCDGADAGGCSTGQCTAACACTAPPGGLADLVPEIAEIAFQFGTSVAPGDVIEGCAESGANLDLLRFTARSYNSGTADLVLGDPQCPAPCDEHPLEVCVNPEFICSPAQGHNHAHYSNYARYELLNPSNQALVVGHKQGFCLLDSICGAPQYTCGNQGLTAGCADQYSASLGCQYLDITGVPAGAYTLRVTLDPFNRIAELAETNNVTQVPVSIVRPSATATPGPTATPTLTTSPTPSPTATATPSPTSTDLTPTPTTTTTSTGPSPTSTPTATVPAPTATATAVAGGCAGATVIPAAGGVFTGTTSGTSTLAGSCATSNNAPERVFQWTPTVSGVATIQTCNATGTSFDSVVYLRLATCAGGTQVACNDDTAGCSTSAPSSYHGSRLQPVVTAGQTYFIIIDGYNGASGSFSLSVTPPATATPTSAAPTPTGPTATATPVPSACTEAIVIDPTGGVFTGTTSGTSTLEGSCATSGNSPERVFQWTPSQSGIATISTCGTSTLFDSVVYLRSGTCQSGTQVACNDDTPGCNTGTSSYHGSRLLPAVTAGQTYFIIVDGYNGASGNFSLTVTSP